MKKYLLICILLGFAATIQANPIVIQPPRIALTELMFDSDGKWVIELECLSGNYLEIDSIFMTTATGKAKLNLEQVNINTHNLEYAIFTVQNDCLNSDLAIRQTGDSIQIFTYAKSEHYEAFVDSLDHPFVYGDFATAKVRSPQVDESISAIPIEGIEWIDDVYSDYYGYGFYYFYYTGVYSINKQPSVGEKNGTEGTYGIVSGKVYDKNNQPISPSDYNRFCSVNHEIDFYLRADGSYSTKAYSFHNQINQIYNDQSGVFSYKAVWYDILPIDFVMEPDSVINIDIYLLDYESNIAEIEKGTEPPLKIYPNPVKEKSFNYEIELPVKSSNSFIELLNMNGQKIAQYAIKNNNGKINLPLGIANGVYTVRLFVNNKNYATQKIVISE
jgi:hypothetical protein